ncbi:unnamed protein product, partial [Dovyalis caffra]
QISKDDCAKKEVDKAEQINQMSNENVNKVVIFSDVDEKNNEVGFMGIKNTQIFSHDDDYATADKELTNGDYKPKVKASKFNLNLKELVLEKKLESIKQEESMFIKDLAKQ